VKDSSKDRQSDGIAAPGPRDNAAALLANFNDPGGGKLLVAGLQLSGEFHNALINEIRSCESVFF
jgi:hypothetical protein